MTSRLRAVAVTPVPTPYRDAFWSVLAERPGLELSVLYCAAGKPDRPWARDWSLPPHSSVLRGWNLWRWRGPTESVYWNPELWSRLDLLSPHVILVGGYNHPSMWAAMGWAVRHGVPFLIMCESYERGRVGPWKSSIKRALVGWVARHAAGGLPTGSRAESYLAAYGLPFERLWRLPNVPDLPQLSARIRELRTPGLRTTLGLDDRRVLLFVGRLIPKKRPVPLIEAFAAVADRTAWQLVLVGEGEQRAKIEAAIQARGLGGHVHVVGQVQPSDVEQWYAAADLFVLPSSETWGVVVLEALAAGLPVIVTDEVGCQPDHVRPGVEGWVVPAGNAGALETALAEAMSGAPLPAPRFPVDGGHESMAEDLGAVLRAVVHGAFRGKRH